MRRLFLLAGVVVAAGAGPWGAGTASADTFGQAYQFRVNSSYDIEGATSIQSTLRAVGAKGYFYVDDRYWHSLSVAQQSQYASELSALSLEFDNVIYPRSVALWGSEATPGVDGDPHVVILVESIISGSGGYFETIHNYTKERTPNGNAREMIFVSAESVLSGNARNFVAHEFQHLISFQQRELLLNSADDVWLNESRSEYSVTVAGYSVPFEGSTLQRRAQSFLRTPSDSLTDWPNTSTDYAIASLFTHYLTERFGVNPFVFAAHTTTAGTAALDVWLADNVNKRFSDIFVDWMIATSLNDRTVDPAYGYKLSGLDTVRVRPIIGRQLNRVSGQTSFSALLKEWQPFWSVVDVDISATTASSAHVFIAGASDVSWRGAIIARYQNGVRVFNYETSNGSTDVSVPLHSGGADLVSLGIAVTQGFLQAVQGRTVLERAVTISAVLGDAVAPMFTPMPTVIPQPIDGDLIRRRGQEEVYVIWGPYRRFLTKGILELYGFQNRPVIEVSDDVFFRYGASNYIRAEGAKQVFAVWPEGSKHWLNITADQWNASGRDWGAIFTVNNAEIAWYVKGVDIVR